MTHTTRAALPVHQTYVETEVSESRDRREKMSLFAKRGSCCWFLTFGLTVISDRRWFVRSILPLPFMP